MQIRLVLGIDQPSLSASDAYKRSSPVVTLHLSPSSISYRFQTPQPISIQKLQSNLQSTKTNHNHLHTRRDPNTFEQLVQEGSQNPRTRLLLSTPLEPSVLRTVAVKSIIQRNPYRHAKVELGLYLLLDSDPMLDGDLPSAGHQSSSSTGNYWLDCAESETSISFHDPNEIPSHLYNPPRLPMMQLLKNWWRYR
ncbi:hypothetical protein PTTG_25930 [Puccinia triticina 1-1 BBBD Race 1]|uniref:Uncharacterized protein n=2 Tax=Puccinia triticina TaxID=208348 RepID=A0A180GY02_PUCT1|nr:uncharacterized protein PtA15_10A575 [Puccinia triticina]OAV97695.1 hypothetical protein PTTG_25930 [Puccinia triticina 1-1 BBBD Race 1]WAQ89151.1 hypothetical protein PtA15_10A575 [Puccinia triticina]